MKILFTSWPALGHVLPMLPLARAAQAAGHEVVISSGADLAPVIERCGFVAHGSGPTLAESYASIAANWPKLSDLPPEEEQRIASRLLFGAGAVQRARDLLPFDAQWQPDLVVHEITELGGPSVAVARGVPHVAHGYGPTMPGIAMFASAIGSAISDAGLTDPIGAVFAAPYLDVCPPALQQPGPSPWSSTLLLRPSAGEPDPDEQLPAEFDELPEHDTVYLTLGTITNQEAGVFREAIEGCTRVGVNVLVTTGPGVQLPAVLQPNVLIAPYISQALLLPRCVAVVSHGGAGTMLGALCHGLPQLCLPQGTDQPYNAAALARTGAGISLPPEQVSADAVESRLRALLEQAHYRAAARALQDQIAAMPDPTDVLGLLTERGRARAG